MNINNSTEELKIIAEIGVNHNGDMKIASDLIVEIAKTEADICKFQYFSADELSTVRAKKSAYQITNDQNETQFSMLKRLELTGDKILELMQECKLQNIEFLATAFSPSKLEWLIDNGQKRIKIASGDMNNPLILRIAAEAGVDVLLSTGMANFEEVQNSVEFMNSHGINMDKLTVLHCTSSYPAPYESLNLLTITKWWKKLGCRIGFSDHSDGALAGIAAVALGASVIEKHVTYDKTAHGPDHKASMEIKDFKKFSADLRSILPALTLKSEQTSECELENRLNVRRSIVASTTIRKGELFSLGNIDFKRPSDGINPMEFKKLIGKPSKRNYKVDDKVDNNEIY
jgi:N,N'-diacetyllegionaminate synthase